MIRLASDPNASRPVRRPLSPAAQAQPGGGRGERPGHPWPFLSRPSQRPQAQAGPRPSRADSAT